MLPPFGYLGSKSTIAPAIVAAMSPHSGYVEPYAGSLAVLLAKAASPMEVVNDLDSRIMTFWSVLRDRPDELLYLAETTPPSRETYRHAATTEPTDDLSIAWTVWTRLTQGRSRSLRYDGSGWRGKYYGSKGDNIARDLDKFRSRLLPAAERIRSVQLECRPALDVIADYGQYPQNLLYVDPPYLGSTRSAGEYALDQQSDDEHRALARALHDCAAAVLLSGYPSELYDDLYPDWHRIDIGAMTNNGGADLSRTECLWSNRRPGTLW